MNQGTMAEKLARVEELAEHARYAEMTLPKRGTCLVDESTAIMDAEYFEELGEYSASLPTGKYFGKRWKRNSNNHPNWKCSGCAHVFSGWGTEGQLCPDAPKCEGTLTHVPGVDVWSMGEYYDCDIPGQIGIKWRKIVVVQP